jgi:X-Pro dipeptidyl-peptidase
MRRLLTLLFVAVTTIALITPVAQADRRPDRPTPPPWLQIRDGVSQPQFALANAIEETVFVETEVDSDLDGKRDRVRLRLSRPGETSTQGIKVPVIFEHSPYRFGTNGAPNHNVDFEVLPQEFIQPRTAQAAEARVSGARPLPDLPGRLDDFWVPRGYAVVLGESIGTAFSDGCPTIGDLKETLGTKAIIDWLNGRAKGFTEQGQPVTADWTTGDVGMTGVSYNGTLPNMVATTGVEGLRTIVPIAAISSWYDWFRSDGVSFRSFGTPTSLAANFENTNARARCGAVRSEMTSGAPANGDYTPMWQQRDYVRSAASVRAAVLSVNGRADLNVKPINWGQWLDALPPSVPRKLWLSQTGHIDPFDFRRAAWVTTLHRWFDRWLLDIRNGIEHEPQVSVERGVDQWSDGATWPPAGTQRQTLYPVAGPVAGVGTLSTAPGPAATSSFTDNGSGTPAGYIASPNAASARRIAYTTGTLAADLRVAGVSRVTVAATPSTPTAHLSAYLVDYGPATSRGTTGEGIRTLATESCWGENRAGDDACYRDTVPTTASVDAQIIARGWADLANHASLSTPRPLTPGTRYTITFRLSTTDWIVPRGHRLGLIVAGNDSSMTTTPAQLPRMTVSLAETSVQLPVVGSLPAVRSAPAPRTALVQPDAVPGRLDG